MNIVFVSIWAIALVACFVLSINFLRFLLGKFKQGVPSFWRIVEIILLSSILSAVIAAIFSFAKLPNILVGSIVSFFVFYFIFNKFQKLEFKKFFGIYILYYTFTFLIIFVSAFSIRYFITQPFVVDGNAMSPTLGNNAYLFVNKLSKNIDRGDVVVFRYPENPQITYIKRAIGLPNDAVEIKNGSVFINGVKIEENYLVEQGKTIGDISTKLKNDEYFVMGDNRLHSSDSREWGVLPKENIIGKAVLPPLIK